MGLPVVSMEDEELFPKQRQKLGLPAERRIPEDGLEEFLNEPDELWWSRLVVAARGYVINAHRRNDERLFAADDAFIFLHKVFAEHSHSLSGIAVVGHLNLLLSVPDLFGILERVDPANRGYLERHPFNVQPFNSPFVALFGTPHSPRNLHTANLQKAAYETFMRLLGLLFGRYREQQKEGSDPSRKKRKGIRFDVDNEWQPDDRVVLFEEFAAGNRTWVLTDFDRHILERWRPRGVHVVFGDRHVEKKLRSGFRLCDHCGMLEQTPQQFPKYNGKRFCTENCFTALLDGREI